MSELFGGSVPVRVAWPVVKLARQPSSRWLAHPVTDRDLAHAYLAHAMFDAHRGDPEFG